MTPSARKVAVQYLQTTPLARLQGLLSALRALHFLHWTTHWQVRGAPFYGDHLMLERMYSAVTAEIDTLAEKMVQMYGPWIVDPLPQVESMRVWLSRWVPERDPYGRALGAERDFQAAVKSAYEDIKAAGAMSLGLDDFLMGVANDHETNLYLLQQRMGGILRTAAPVQSGAAAPSAESYFFHNPRKHETRDFHQSGAISNLAEVAAVAATHGRVEEGIGAVLEAVYEAPPHPTENRDATPGGEHFSTLSRYLVETAHVTHPDVPTGRHEIDRHPKLATRVAARWASRPQR